MKHGLTIAIGMSCGQVAFAQSGGIEEITVTARYREENLQQTPIAISAVTGEALESRSFTNVAEIGQIVPNAYFKQAPGQFGRSTQAFIRGVGQGDFKLSFESGVGMYVDDVYYSDVLGSVFDLTDIERIEVLRGPQGTLFGKNSLGGAVRVISRRPQGDNTGYLEASYGSYDRIDLRGSYDFALVEDRLFARVAGVSKHRDGYGKRLDFACEMQRRGTPELAGIGDGLAADGPDADTLPDVVAVGSDADNAFSIPSLRPGAGREDCVLGRTGGEDVQGGRVMLRWVASDDLEVNFSVDYTNDDSEIQADSLKAIGSYNAATVSTPSTRCRARTWACQVA